MSNTCTAPLTLLHSLVKAASKQQLLVSNSFETPAQFTRRQHYSLCGNDFISQSAYQLDGAVVPANKRKTLVSTDIQRHEDFGTYRRTKTWTSWYLATQRHGDLGTYSYQQHAKMYTQWTTVTQITKQTKCAHTVMYILGFLSMNDRHWRLHKLTSNLWTTGNEDYTNSLQIYERQALKTTQTHFKSVNDRQWRLHKLTSNLQTTGNEDYTNSLQIYEWRALKTTQTHFLSTNDRHWRLHKLTSNLQTTGTEGYTNSLPIYERQALKATQTHFISWSAMLRFMYLRRAMTTSPSVDTNKCLQVTENYQG